MAELTAPQQNRLLGQLANMLRATEGDIAAPEFLPRGLDVMGLVRQLMLPSAETVEKLSYGDPLFRMPMQSNIPITADREYLADIAGMIPFGAPAARPTARGMQDLVRQIQTEPPVGAISPEIAAKIFPETKIVDESGSPLVAYHGTQRVPEGIQEFQPTGSGYAGQESAGLNWFTTDPQEASGYANWIEGAGNPTVYPVYLDIRKPASLDDYNNIVESINKQVKETRSKGKFAEYVDSTTPEIGLYDKRIVEALKDKGFDGIRWTNAEFYGGPTGYPSDAEQVILPFSSKQIKSVFGE